MKLTSSRIVYGCEKINNKYTDLSLYLFFRHEVPVSSEKIRIIHIDDDMVVVNKPASIPVSRNAHT